MNLIDKKSHKEFSRREIIIICICLLELAIIIFEVYSDNHMESVSLIVQNIFTLVTSIICSVTATALLPKVLQGNSEQELSGELEKTLNKLLMIPSNGEPVVYEDTDIPHKDFNERLNKSIAMTNQYIYFGDRALYLTKRLGRDIDATTARFSLTVILADIRDADLYEARKEIYMRREQAKRREHTATGVNKSVAEIIKEEKISVLESLYALGKLMDRYDIHVYLHKEIPFIRFEITDTLLAMTFLTQWSSGKKYPTTLLYENEELFRMNFLDYADEVKERSSELKKNELTLSSLKSLGIEAGLTSITYDDIINHYEACVK